MAPLLRRPQYATRLEIHRSGLLHYWVKPLAVERRGHFVLLERSVTRHLAQFTALTAELYNRAGYVDDVDLGVAVIGIEPAIGASLLNTFSRRKYGAPDYRRNERVTMSELCGDSRGIVRRLLAPLFDVISQAQYDPFDDRS